MIESAGGMIPFLCHVFLILFGGFFGLNFAFNKNFAQNSFGFDNIQASYMGRPLGFLMTGCVLMAFLALFGIQNLKFGSPPFFVSILTITNGIFFKTALFITVIGISPSPAIIPSVLVIGDFTTRIFPT